MPTAQEALPGRPRSDTDRQRTCRLRPPAAGPLSGRPGNGGCSAMGCFWGAERLFWQTDGVWVTAVGYAGGLTPNPTYRETTTGHDRPYGSGLVVLPIPPR